MPRILLFLFCLPILGYTQVYNITRYSIEEGLAQSQVRSILQDSRGYIWFGTHRGLSQFDGKQFQNYDLNDGLAGNFIAAIHEDSQANIWLGTEHGISRFNGRNFLNISTKDGLTDNEILSIQEIAEGEIWIGTRYGGLNIYRDKRVWHQAYDWQEKLRKRSIFSIFQDPQNRIWLGTDQGLFMLEGDSLTHLSKKQELPDFEVYDIALVEGDEIWMGTNDGVWVAKEGTFMHFTQNMGIIDQTVYCLSTDEENGIWIGTKSGVSRFSQGQWQSFSIEEGFPQNHVRSAILDREGNLWLGEEGGGVSKITKGIFENYTIEDGLSSNIVKSFLEDETANIWISTYDRGVNQMEADKIIQYHRKNGLGDEAISYSYRDRKGRLWFATYTGGLSVYVNGKFRTYTTKDGLLSNEVYCIAEDRLGRIWLGTKLGISVFDGENFWQYKREDGLVSNSVYAIYEDRKGAIWLGTQGGVSRFFEDEFQNFTTEQGLSDNFVLSIVENQSGHLWCGTGNGVSYWDGERFSSFMVDDVPGANLVVSLVLEDEQYLWVGTNNGIYRIDMSTYEIGQRPRSIRFTKTDGLPSLECNANAALKDQAGNIWFGTIEGAVMCPKGAANREQQLQPLTHIINLRLFREDVDWAAKDSIDSFTGLPASLKLPFHKNYLTFDFIGISLTNPSEVSYRFMLENFDRDWLPETKESSATYSNLPPGEYTFKIQASNSPDNWEVEPTSFSFTIRKPYYQTTWFKLLMLLLVAIISFITYKIVMGRIEQIREKRRMESEAEMLRLEHQALYAMMNPHFTFNALQSIQYYIHRQDKIAANKFLSSFAKLIRKNLESTQRNFISIAEEVERLRLYLSLEKMRFKDKLAYEITVDEELDQHDTQIPPMIIQPFVENSIKHGIMPLGGEGMVKVEILIKDENHLLVRVRDNGIGIEASQKARSLRKKDHTSKGMQITSARLQLFAQMTGKEYTQNIHEIKNEAGEVEGTMVEMILPREE